MLLSIGIIGQGFVGGALRAYFDRDAYGGDRFRLHTYDKVKGGSLDDVVAKSDIIFVCVPTPMRDSGECYTGIVEEVLTDIVNVSQKIGRPRDSFVVCIKSTVPPGFTDRMGSICNLRLTFSPEFLTEKNSIRDMIDGNRVVVGGSLDDANQVLSLFYFQDMQRVKDGELILVRVEPKVAEMVKLFTNGLLFTKVMFCNEIYQMCRAMGIPYEEVRAVGCLDPRVGASHTQVPGPDGHLGAGGHCFPKDMNSLAFEATRLETGERMFSAVLDRNDELRQEKDWQDMKDRAVTDR